ncbi:MAG: diacylglycerol kinase [Bacteroidetes bacterium 24-39-8]|jgi:dihydrofolate reductase|nr:MAG: diacylglycerol kinase [Sphingobacteriia bacterium 35-40-8]OYZ50870.1 MAG: diacylglycerol kinase [Bacteroidetes bacterium 24-39-8]OZA65521.1 MAG: diacylglycerol kinase [Sphingobacteriia bacterium 39-39-8]HQR91960.1 dihydrofolate reductase [Sediminibacterium sp.]HQS54339.1 dihydrofolate reductase [Sediminibacterium sp.]
MNISLVVAASSNHAIGLNNQLLWHLPKDMRFFKNRTWAMPVIMGRKTFESLSGKALPGRMNIVLTRQKDWQAAGVYISNTLEEAYAIAEKADYKEVYIIGGADIYSQSLAQAQTVYLTRVEAVLEGDSFFPELGADWTLVDEQPHLTDAKHAYPFCFQTWKKKG